MNAPAADRKSKEAPELAYPVNPIRHLTEADLTEDDRSRLFSCLNRGKRWFDKPAYPSSMRRQKHSPTARVQQDRIDPPKSA